MKNKKTQDLYCAEIYDIDHYNSLLYETLNRFLRRLNSRTGYHKGAVLQSPKNKERETMGKYSKEFKEQALLLPDERGVKKTAEQLGNQLLHDCRVQSAIV